MCLISIPWVSACHAEIDAVELSVLNAVMAHGLDASYKFVTIAETTTGDSAGIFAKNRSPETLADLWQIPTALLVDWRDKNLTPETIVETFELPINYQMLSGEHLTEIFVDEDAYAGWRRYYERFQDSAGILRISRVGFDSNQSAALVYMEHQCGLECGQGRVVYLTYDPKEGWQPLLSIIVWIAEI
ncbi:MAG: hypothetical protein AAF384_12375 [Pseudomonadota bacterium]